MHIENVIAERLNSKAILFTVNGVELALIPLENGNKVLTTVKLHEYTMPVSEKWEGREHTELAFFLPSYWDADSACPNLKWTSNWLARLANHCIEKNTWFGPGHTIAAGNPPEDLSPTMKMRNFIFTNPIELEHTLAPKAHEGKLIYFLTVIPIFGDELDYKTGKGTLKFLRKFVLKGASEKLDDYRLTFLKSRWKMF